MVLDGRDNPGANNPVGDNPSGNNPAGDNLAGNDEQWRNRNRQEQRKVVETHCAIQIRFGGRI